MKRHKITLSSADGDICDVNYYTWRPKKISGWIHIIHGMSEHAARYENLGRYLQSNGYFVSASDNRGHGQTGLNSNNANHLGDHKSWDLLINDQKQLLIKLKQETRLHPLIIGHSMGALLALNLSQECYPTDKVTPSGLVLSGVTCSPSLLYRLGKMIAFFEKLRLGRRSSSKLLQYLSFETFNRALGATRTEADWISRDPSVVDRYISDPLCGQPLTTQSWLDFFAASSKLFTPVALKRLKSELPIYLVAGDQDPVGRFGRDIHALFKKLSNAGLCDVYTKIYVGGRHEMFNEINQNEVYLDLLKWIKYCREKEKKICHPKRSPH